MIMKSRKLIAALASVVLLAGVGACGSSEDKGASKPPSSSQESKPKAQPKKEEKPADLTGSWKQSNPTSQDQWMEATVAADTIEIDWVQKDQKSLYWKGSYTAPTTPGDTYKWTSRGDTEAMHDSLLGSQDATKDFTYTGGQITYEQSALGTTTTVRLARQ